MANGKAGRPTVKIDWQLVKNELLSGCSKIGMAEKLGVSVKTLDAACLRDFGQDFSTFSEVKFSVGKNMLRVAQFKNAMEGSEAMQKFLGKNWLGQTDKIEHKSETTVTLASPQLSVEQIKDLLK